MSNIFQTISKSSFLFIKDPKSKKDIFSQMANEAHLSHKINKNQLLNSLIKREKIGSTSVGNGIAIPHISINSLLSPKFIVCILSKGINFDSVDNINVDIIFLLLLPENPRKENLQTLASVSRLLRNSELTNKLRGCKNQESAIAIFSKVLEDKAA